MIKPELNLEDRRHFAADKKFCIRRTIKPYLSLQENGIIKIIFMNARFKPFILFIFSQIFVHIVFAYEPEFVGYIDKNRPRLTDNPASISQLDSDYFEIEPPASYEKTNVQNERAHYQMLGSESDKVSYENEKTGFYGFKFATRDIGLTLRWDQSNFENNQFNKDEKFQIKKEESIYRRTGFVLGTTLGKALFGIRYSFYNHEYKVEHNLWDCGGDYLFYGDTTEPNEYRGNKCKRLITGISTSYTKPTLGTIISLGSFLVIGATYEPSVETTYESDSKISELRCVDDPDNKGCNFILG